MPLNHFTTHTMLAGTLATAVLTATAPADQAWFSATLNGEEAKAPTAWSKPLETTDAARKARLELWANYKQAATSLKWDKAQLPTPPTIEEIIAMPKEKRPKLRPSALEAYEKKMPYIFLAKGKKPEGGWPLFICLHGGGKYYEKAPLKGPHAWGVNSREWQAQMRLTQRVYKPAGLYFIPRMADDNMGRWWHKHNIDIFQRMIKNAILFNDVNPNKVYIMGISQGGYGSCHLGPFMADRFAAAGPMAGGMMTVTENLRNLPFRSDIGEKDTAYRRIELAKELHAKIDEHHKADPAGYINQLAVQKGRGHGIDYSKCPTWLAQHERNPYPTKVVWRCHQKDGIYQKNFYWLGVSDTPAKGEYQLTATADRKTNTITVSGTEVIPQPKSKEKKKAPAPMKQPLAADKVVVHLNDTLVDLNKPVTVIYNGKQAFKGKVKRSAATMAENIAERGDIYYAFPAKVQLK